MYDILFDIKHEGHAKHFLDDMQITQYELAVKKKVAKREAHLYSLRKPHDTKKTIS